MKNLIEYLIPEACNDFGEICNHKHTTNKKAQLTDKKFLAELIKAKKPQDMQNVIANKMKEMKGNNDENFDLGALASVLAKAAEIREKNNQ